MRKSVATQILTYLLLKLSKFKLKPSILYSINKITNNGKQQLEIKKDYSNCIRGSKDPFKNVPFNECYKGPVLSLRPSVHLLNARLRFVFPVKSAVKPN